MFDNRLKLRTGFRQKGFRNRPVVSASVSTPSLIDSYSESNADAVSGTDSDRLHAASGTSSIGESFTGVNKRITSCKFFLGRGANAITGKVRARLYWGIDEGDGMYPDGAPIAISDEVDVSVLNTTRALIEFFFRGEQSYLMENGVSYVLQVAYDSGDATHYVTVGIDGTSPTHSGQNLSYFDGDAFMPDSSIATCFYVYGV